MKISVSHGNQNFKPVQVAGVQELLDLITQSNYSLGVFRDGNRKNHAFTEAHAVGLDFDGGMLINDAKVAFKDYKCVIAPTRNHRKAKNGVVDDRFRVILLLKDPITDPKVFKSFVVELLRKYPQADKACSDAARMFYPSSQGEYNRGEKFIDEDVSIPEPKNDLDEALTLGEKKGNLSRKTMEFMLFGAAEGFWNGRLFQAAKDMQEQGYALEEALAELKVATRKYSGQLDETDTRTIESAFSEPPKYSARENASGFNFKPVGELMRKKPEVNWLVDGLFSVGGFSLMVGAPKSGKSTLTRQLAMAVARGTQFLDRKVKKGKVMYLALEEQEEMLYSQLKKIGVTDDDNILMHVGGLFCADKTEQLLEIAEEFRPSLIVIDTLILFANSDANSYNEMNQALAGIRNVARETGAHICAIHHQNKREDKGTGSILGSSAIHGAVDNALILNMRPGTGRILNSSQRGGVPFIGQRLDFEPQTETYTLGSYEEEF